MPASFFTGGFFLPPLRNCRSSQNGACLPDKGGKGPVIVQLRHQEMRPGAGIGAALLLLRKHLQPRLRYLDIQLVVTHQTEECPAAVQSVVPKHFSEGNIPGMPELETNILYYIRGRSHAGLSHASPARCKKQMTAGKADGRNEASPLLTGKGAACPTES